MIDWLIIFYDKLKKFSFKTKWRATVYPQAGVIYVHRKRFFDKQWRIIHTEKVIKR